ncbi:MAG: hypothetical protein Q4D79_05700 [Propionibacteriaceae bacterium]|nr:hypothetical protein [Propionibacteriaceae bacterium]
MPVTLKPSTVSDLEVVRRVSIDTFVETFAEQNSADDIDRYGLFEVERGGAVM